MKMDKGTVRAEVTLHRKRVVDGDKKGDLKELTDKIYRVLFAHG